MNCLIREVPPSSVSPPAKVFVFKRSQNVPCASTSPDNGCLCKHSCCSTAETAGEETQAREIQVLNKEIAKPFVVDRHTVRGYYIGKLPPKKGSRLYRSLRWNYGTVYRRIFCLSGLGNVLAIICLFLQNLHTGSGMSMTTASTAASSNTLAAFVVRNEHVVNAIFAVFSGWTKHLPLSMRRSLAKVYCYGGVHSGCSVAATLWYAVLLVLMTREFTSTDSAVLRCYIYFVSYTAFALLCVIIIFALPRLRVRMHNWFEGVHRFAGWGVVFLFWTQTLLVAADAASIQDIPYAMVLATTPTLWFLVAITLLIIYPWTRLRLRDVEAQVLSDHCVKLNFKYANAQYGQAVRLSDAPMKETHAFAVIPNDALPTAPDQAHLSHSRHTCITPDNTALGKFITLTTTPVYLSSSSIPQKGFSVLVSNAGDWTQRMIRNPPSRIYTRGVPQYGVLRVASLFSPVVIVATGSGIGPCLSLFVQKPDHPVRIIWSAQCPAQSFGQDIVNLIYRTDPGAVIIDTKKMGRVDLVRLAYRMWEGIDLEGEREEMCEKKGKREGQCEAVVVISNQTVTKKVIYELESRGVPAYGAIFDS